MAIISCIKLESIRPFCDTKFAVKPRSRDSLLIYEFRACSHDPEITHCPGATHWLQGQLCLSARSDVCNCSHDFFVAMGQLREAGCLTPGKGRFPLGGIFRGDIVFVF